MLSSANVVNTKAGRSEYDDDGTPPEGIGNCLTHPRCLKVQMVFDEMSYGGFGGGDGSGEATNNPGDPDSAEEDPKTLDYVHGISRELDEAILRGALGEE